ncbi:MAG: PilN domain-containing protein [Actinomycetota bacterium]
MMRRIELLPESHLARRRQRRSLGLVVVAGLVVLALLLGYWLVLGMRVADARRELANARADSDVLQAEIDSLQRFAQLEAEVNEKQAALTTVMAGDVAWPAVLTEVAMLVPGEIWLTNLAASAGQTEGATAVGTETAAVRIAEGQPFGRIQFTGRSLSMPGVAKWLMRLGDAEEFDAPWLSDATEADLGDSGTVFDFNSTLELNERAASARFQEGLNP